MLSGDGSGEGQGHECFQLLSLFETFIAIVNYLPFTSPVLVVAFLYHFLCANTFTCIGSFTKRKNDEKHILQMRTRLP